MTDHVEIREALAGYALDTLEPAEVSTVEAHLVTCAECRAELDGFRRVVAGIGMTTRPEAPSPGLKSRVLQQALHRPLPASDAGTARAWWRGPAGLAVAASLALAVAAGVWAITMRDELMSRDRTVAILTAPDVQRVDLKGQGSTARASARAYWSTSRGLVFNAESLPPLDPGHVYQLWTIHNGKPASAGLLRPDATGAAAHQSAPPVGATVPEAVAVSIEPAGGVSSPTGAIVLVGKPS
jgi:anti-sigma-K factor RskA